MYIKPEIEVIPFQIKDVIKTSNTDYEDGPGEGDIDEF